MNLEDKDKVDVLIKVKDGGFSIELSHEIFKGIPIFEEEKKDNQGLHFQ